jgi:hypothetical protein
MMEETSSSSSSNHGSIALPDSRQLLLKIFELFGVESEEQEKRDDKLPANNKSTTSHLSILYSDTPLVTQSSDNNKPKSRARRRTISVISNNSSSNNSSNSPLTSAKSIKLSALRMLERIDGSQVLNRRLRYNKLKAILVESVFHSPERGDLDDLLGYSKREIHSNIRLTFSECYTKMCYLAGLRYPDMKVEVAVEMACSTYLYPYVTKTVQTATKLVRSFAAWITDDADVAAMFHYYQAPLYRVFMYYSKKITPHSELSKKGMFMWNNTMSEAAFILFASELNVIPNFVQEMHLKKIFSAIKSYQKKSDAITESALSYLNSDIYKQNFDITEFMEGLARIASTFHNGDSIQHKCRDLLEYLEEEYRRVFGEPMVTEKSRVIHNKQRRNVDKSLITTQFDLETITGEKNHLMTKDEAYQLRYDRKSKQKHGNDLLGSYDNPLQRTDLSRIIENSISLDNNIVLSPTERGIETEQDLVNVFGKPIFMLYRNESSIHRVYSAYCSADPVQNSTTLMTLKQWTLFCNDFGFVDSLYTVMKNRDDSSDYCSSVFAKRATKIEFKILYMTFNNFLHAIYDLWLKVQEEMHESPDLYLPKRDTLFSHFFTEHFQSRKVEIATSKLRERNLNDKSRFRVHPLRAEKTPYDVIPKKTFRQFDVFKGPKMIAKCEDQPGYVIYEGGNDRNSGTWNRNPYMKLILLNTDDDEVNFDEDTKEAIVRHSSIANTFNQFIERLLDHGLDVVGSVVPMTYSNSASNTIRSHRVETIDDVHNREYIVGRSWRLTQDLRVIGCMNDHPGNFCCLEWQSHDSDDMKNPNCSMTLYIPPGTSLFSMCYNLFTKATSLENLRELLARAQIEAIPTLYF